MEAAIATRIEARDKAKALLIEKAPRWRLLLRFSSYIKFDTPALIRAATILRTSRCLKGLVIEDLLPKPSTVSVVAGGGGAAAKVGPVLPPPAV